MSKEILVLRKRTPVIKKGHTMTLLQTADAVVGSAAFEQDYVLT